jgi:hypothetical protein
MQQLQEVLITHSLTHLLTYLLTHLLTYSLTHSGCILAKGVVIGVGCRIPAYTRISLSKKLENNENNEGTHSLT